MRRFLNVFLFVTIALPVAEHVAIAQQPPGIVPLTPNQTKPLDTLPPLLPAHTPTPSGTEKGFTPVTVGLPVPAQPGLSDAIPPPPVVMPSLVVEMVGPEIANVGSPMPFELVVKNTGKQAAANVRVEDELPAGFSYLGGEPKADAHTDHLTWPLGTIEPGAERRIKVLVKSNTEGELRSKATVTFSSSCSLSTRFTRPKLQVTMTGPETAMLGDVVAFQIRVANVGTGPIPKVRLSDRLPPGLVNPEGNQIEADLGPLAAGESRTVTLRTTAAKTGIHLNQLMAYADTVAAANGVQLAGGPQNPDLVSTAKSEVRVLEPGLQVRQTGPKTCLVKCEALFSIDLTNPGSAPSRNVRIVDRLPDGVEFIGASEEGTYDPATRTVGWVLTGQEPGAHKVLTVKTRGVAIAESSNVVMAQADGGLQAKAEEKVVVEGIAAVALEVSDPDDPAPIGSDAMYEIRVLNQGSCPCTGIQIIAVMPDGMEVREVSAPAPYKVVGQQVQFASFARLATKADLMYRIKVKMSKPGDIRFKVQLTCDQLQQPVSKEESSKFYKP